MPTPITETNASPTRAITMSLTLRGALTMAIAYAADRIGVHLPGGATADIAGAVFDLAFAVGLALVGIGRARASAPLA